jgi:hypothetical protein
MHWGWGWCYRVCAINIFVWALVWSRLAAATGGTVISTRLYLFCAENH